MLINQLISVQVRELEFKAKLNRLNYNQLGLNNLKLVCYYGSWAVYRPENGKFPVENIDPFLCR